MKETDSRIREFADTFFKLYKDKYEVSPCWSKKEGELTRRMWQRCDLDKISGLTLYEVLKHYLASEDEFLVKIKHSAAHFCSKFEVFLIDYRQSQAKRVFAPKPKDVADKALKQIPVTKDMLMAQIKKRHENPESFVRYMQNLTSLEAVRTKTGNIFDQWKRWWAIGGQIWGKEVLNALWNQKEENHAQKVKEQARALLRSSVNLR